MDFLLARAKDETAIDGETINVELYECADGLSIHLIRRTMEGTALNESGRGVYLHRRHLRKLLPKMLEYGKAKGLLTEEELT